jgi:hypothetical protein
MDLNSPGSLTDGHVSPLILLPGLQDFFVVEENLILTDQ